MKIVQTYSHLNGLEYLLVHKKKLWKEVCQVIEAVRGNDCKTKVSKEKGMVGDILYSPIDMNKAFTKLLAAEGWTEMSEEKIQSHPCNPWLKMLFFVIF